jgi:hypothetical protein
LRMRWSMPQTPPPPPPYGLATSLLLKYRNTCTSTRLQCSTQTSCRLISCYVAVSSLCRIALKRIERWSYFMSS